MSLPEFITVWICEDCGNYYAASSAGDLLTKINTDKETKKPSFPRARCPTPTCAAMGTMRKPINLRMSQLMEHAGNEHRARRGEPPVATQEPSPNWSGELCAACATEMVRTGVCLTCPNCGETTGCG